MELVSLILYKKNYFIYIIEYIICVITKIIHINIYVYVHIFFFTDDCVNIISIMNHLAQQGCVFKATNKLISV